MICPVEGEEPKPPPPPKKKQTQPLTLSGKNRNGPDSLSTLTFG